MKTTMDFLQTDGAHETLEAAGKQWLGEHPDMQLTGIVFQSAFPSGPEGRWVTLRITFQEKA